jgi:hypothetical protein
MEAMLEELLRKARELPRSLFVAQLEALYLVYRMDGAEPKSADFKTGYFPSVARRKAVSTNSAATSALPSATGVLRVAKAAHNPFSDRISVGRSVSCDMVLRVTNVSKLHAHFLQTDAGEWEIRDNGSTNGTFVNGVRVGAGQRIVVRPGDYLRLGQCEARLVDAGQLFDLLHGSRP